MKSTRSYLWYIMPIILILAWACENPLEVSDETQNNSENPELVATANPNPGGGNGGVGGGNGNGNGNGNGGGKGNGGNSGVGGGKKGVLYGDMYVLYRDDNGVPILTEEGYVQPIDANGDRIPLDEEGHPLDEEATIEVELGRTNVVRSPEKTIQRGLDEVLGILAQSDTIKTDVAGRLITYIDGVEKTTDAPIENLALYKEMMNNGSIQVNLKSGVTIKDGLEVMFDGNTKPDEDDMLVASSFLAAATDKSEPLTLDEIIYMNTILGLEGSIEQEGTYYIDFSNFIYDREERFGNKTVEVLVESPEGSGYYQLETQNVYETVFNGFQYNETGGAAVFTTAADDAREVINYVHDHGIE